MNDISTDRDLFASLGLVRQSQEKPRNTLEMGDFLELMTTELTHQDPFKPMENTELATQMSQFATVSGIDDLNKGFASLSESLSSDQALQAANLVGHEVLVPANTGYLATGGSVRGVVELDSSASHVVLKVTNAAGALVREIELGTRSPGPFAFSWDGIADSGDFAPPGRYRFSVEAEVDGEPVALPLLMSAQVDSVSVGASGQGIALNLEGLGPVALRDVAEIH